MHDLAERRLQTVRDHMALEITCDWDAVIATFEHPRYEMATGAVFDAPALSWRAPDRTPLPAQVGSSRGPR